MREIKHSLLGLDVPLVSLWHQSSANFWLSPSWLLKLSGNYKFKIFQLHIYIFERLLIKTQTDINLSLLLHTDYNHNSSNGDDDDNKTKDMTLTFLMT